MANAFEHKGFLGQFNYEPGDKAFHGTAVGLRDVIHFQGRSVAELEKSFRESVDDYLRWLETEVAERDIA